MIDRLRSGLDPLRKDDPPRDWWDVLLWMPVGFAVTRLVGNALPAVAMVLLAVLLAAAHHFGPAVVDVVAGAGGLLATQLAVWDGNGCQVLVGDMGIVVIVVFGSIFVVSSWVRLIGSASLREMGRHLLIATVTIEIALFAIAPNGEPLVKPDSIPAPLFLAAILMAVSQLGLIDRMELGMLSLGALLLPVEISLATRGNPCGAGGYAPLLGMVAFAGAAYYFATSRPVPADGDEPVHKEAPKAPEGQMGAWVDATPETGVWVDTSKNGIWVDGTPETGTWLDDDYEDDFRDPDVSADLTYEDDDEDEPLAIDDAPHHDDDR